MTDSQDGHAARSPSCFCGIHPNVHWQFKRCARTKCAPVWTTLIDWHQTQENCDNFKIYLLLLYFPHFVPFRPIAGRKPVRNCLPAFDIQLPARQPSLLLQQGDFDFALLGESQPVSSSGFLTKGRCSSAAWCLASMFLCLPLARLNLALLCLALPCSGFSKTLRGFS